MRARGTALCIPLCHRLISSPPLPLPSLPHQVPSVPQEVAKLMEGINISDDAAHEAMEQLSAEQWFKVMSVR